MKTVKFFIWYIGAKPRNIKDVIHLIKLVTRQKITDTFERTWKNARIEPPKEGGRYWCLIEEQNYLGKSHFQWNCSYHEIEKRWSDNHEDYNVIYWTELAPMPF